MKKISSLYILNFFLLISVLLISSCGGDDDSPTAEQTNRELLTSGTWKVNSVKVDGADQTALFTGFTLQFSSLSYTSTNGDPVWPNIGNWLFTNAESTIVQRDDGVMITISSLTESSLVFTLTWDKTTIGPGRVSSVKGTHTFALTK